MRVAGNDPLCWQQCWGHDQLTTERKQDQDAEPSKEDEADLEQTMAPVVRKREFTIEHASSLRDAPDRLQAFVGVSAQPGAPSSLSGPGGCR